MNDDYLWNKSGDSDAEIERLEAALAPLRFQPTRLALPVRSTRRFRLPMAIAASILLALLAGIAWLSINRRATAPHESAVKNDSIAPKQSPAPTSSPTVAVVTNQTGDAAATLPPQRPAAPGRRIVKLDPDTRREAQIAAQELVRALRFASVKFNEAQRRAQVNRPSGPAS